MSKRKRPREPESLPLFDLPLTPPGEADDPPLESGADASPRPVEVPDPVERSPEPPPPPVQVPLPTPDPAPSPVPTPAGPQVAPLGERLLAGLADLVIHGLLLLVASFAVRALGVVTTSGDWPSFALLLLPFSFLYWVVPLAFWGQTPGMAWRGHGASALDGEPLTFAQSALRWLGAVLTFVLVGLPLLLLPLTGSSLSDRLSQSQTRSV